MNRRHHDLSGESTRPVKSKNSKAPRSHQKQDVRRREVCQYADHRRISLERVDVVESMLADQSISSKYSRTILGHWLKTSGQLFSQLLERITPGQRPVLCAFLREPNDHYVARELGLRESTVRNHMTIIECKLNAESRQHLVAMCMAALIREALLSSQID